VRLLRPALAGHRERRSEAMRILSSLRRLAPPLALAGVLALAGCDPETLSDEQRLAVTGTTDIGTVTLRVEPADAVLGAEPVEFRYTVTDTSLSGTVTLGLEGLVPEVEVVQELAPSSFRFSLLPGTGQTANGTLRLRARGGRAEPVDIRLTMVSVG